MALGLAALTLATGASGTDWAAAEYRVAQFRRIGFALWDPGWYGGHWTLGYSVLLGPLGAAFGLVAIDIVCVALAALAFDYLVVPRFGRAGRVGSWVFAAGTVVQVVIGRVPFLLGGTFALIALAMLSRRARGGVALAVLLALASSFASPLAGLFLGLASCAGFLAALPRRDPALAACALAAVVPVILLELLFPGQGRMPFAVSNFLDTLGILGAVALLAGRRHRAVAIGAVLYALLVVVAYTVPSALGSNATRLVTSVGLGLVLCLPARSLRARSLLGVAVVLLLLGQWMPARGALLGWRDPATSAAYFRPLLRYLVAHDRPLARVEVVPLSTHWESYYVALRLPIARGWERQFDTADNPIFYDGRLDARTYRAWLEHNGVRFVALARAPLDYSGLAEAKLLRGGVAGLRPVWRNAHWRVWELPGGPGIVSGPARLLSESGSRLVLDVSAPGRVLVRERWSDWSAVGARTPVARSAGGWILVHARRPGRLVLEISP